jgi:2-polyprenyl-3-methyl-5-hydroxy-6-metoxy-1,4-benzoquinol methylase
MKRVSQRGLFDGVADLYDATRQSYPDEIVEVIMGKAELKPGSSVLEIGCGTAQLTRQLAGRGLDITAIDIGQAMVAAAKRNVADPSVAFQVTSFEDFQASQAYDLIVSATAFHWVDPDVGLAKAARLLQPSGWLALLTRGERYDELLRSSLQRLWAPAPPGPNEVGPGRPVGRAVTRDGPLRHGRRGNPRTAP